MQFSSSHTLPIEYQPRPITEDEKHAFISWLRLEYIYEVESTNSVDSYAEIEQSLNSSLVAVFEHSMQNSVEKIIAVIGSSNVQIYSFESDGQFALEEEYEQV
jgi:hypothetical protein